MSLCRALAVWTQGSNSCTRRGISRLLQSWETGTTLRAGVSQAWLQTPANRLTPPQMLTPMIKTKLVSASSTYSLLYIFCGIGIFELNELMVGQLRIEDFLLLVCVALSLFTVCRRILLFHYTCCMLWRFVKIFV